MMISLVAALQVAMATPEIVWADISVSDTRGSTFRTEILPKIEVEGDWRVLRSLTARRTTLFGEKPTSVEWTDTAKCPRLRAALDAVVDVKPLTESSLAKSYEGPAFPPPPPPHRDVAQVRVGNMTMTVLPGSPLGKWVEGVYEATANCWADVR